MAEGSGSGRWPFVMALLVLLMVILAQAQRIGESSDRIVALEGEVEVAESRLLGARTLLEEAETALAIQEARAIELEAYIAADALIPVPPTDYPQGAPHPESPALTARSLHRRIRVLKDGDPDLLAPSPEGGMVVFFDELL